MPPASLPMFSQTIENRYINKGDLTQLLRQLFGRNFIVEVGPLRAVPYEVCGRKLSNL